MFSALREALAIENYLTDMKTQSRGFSNFPKHGLLLKMLGFL